MFLTTLDAFQGGLEALKPRLASVLCSNRTVSTFSCIGCIVTTEPRSGTFLAYGCTASTPRFLARKLCESLINKAFGACFGISHDCIISDNGLFVNKKVIQEFLK